MSDERQTPLNGSPLTHRPAERSDEPVQLSAAAFWQFSLMLYPRCQHQLLQWQDQYQAQINLLLFLAWRFHQPCASWQNLQQALLPTHQQFTLPLRQLRRQADAGTALRQQLLQAELAAEQLEQQALCQCAAPQSSTGGTELSAYLHTLAVPTAAAAGFLLDLDQAGLPQPPPPR